MRSTHRRRARDGLCEAGLAQDRNLRSVELLAAEIVWIERVGIDQDGVLAGATEHGRRARAGKPSTHYGDVGMAHRPNLCLQRA